MSNTVGRRRWLRALRRVFSVERSSPVLPSTFRPRPLQCSDRAAWTSDHAMELIDPEATSAEGFRTWAPVRASAVLIGKFDVQREIRLRAFYPERQETSRFQAGGKNNGVHRTVAAHRIVREHDDGLMPRLLDHGGNDKVAYLVEEFAHGRVAVFDEIPDLAEPIARRLSAVHDGAGTSAQRLSEITHRDFSSRWSEVAQAAKIDPALSAAVTELIGRDALLDVSIGHGDLVASNIMVTNDGFRLIDWEYAGQMPIAFDLAKLTVAHRDHQRVHAAVHRGVGSRPGTRRDHYTFDEQIALAHAQMLSWNQARAARAKAAGRTSFLRSGMRRRVQALRYLLEV